MEVDPEDYFRDLERLIAQEKGHVQLLEKYPGKVDRIQRPNHLPPGNCLRIF